MGQSGFVILAGKNSAMIYLSLCEIILQYLMPRGSESGIKRVTCLTQRFSFQAIEEMIPS